MEMTVDELTRYLKMASDLESSIYRQEQVINHAKREMRAPNIAMRQIEKPIDRSKTLEPPNPEAEKYKTEAERDPNYNFWLSSDGYKIVGIIVMILAVMFIPVGVYSMARYGKGLVFCIVLAIIMGVTAAWSLSKSRSLGAFEESDRIAKKAAYEIDLKEFEQKLAKAKESYPRELEQYERAVEEERKDYELRKKRADKTHALEIQQLEKLNKLLEETQELLSRLYSNGWIFEKYRNMIAMTTIYEYFASGRCTELKGPDGAYNLFESELRQNLILNKLDTISSQLEDIKQNQFVLYTELKRTNELIDSVVDELRDINHNVRYISNKTDEIAEFTRLTAHYSSVTAENTEALKYITLVTQ